MKKTILTSACLLVLCFAQAQVMWQIKTDEVKKWYYADGDEFNTNEVNTAKWNYTPDWGGAVIKQNVIFTEGPNVKIADGVAHFIFKKEDYMGHINPWEVDTVWAKKNNIKIENETTLFKYTAGALWSKQKYKYGYFECRFKSNDERGLWPAFWLYAGHDNDEIDWFELKGERFDQAHVDVHCPNGCENYRGGFMKLQRGWGGWVKTTKSLSQEYNIISGEWNEDYLVWYINGKPVGMLKHKFEYPMWLVLNTNIASDKSGGFSPGPDATTKFPNEYLVDYVRVWSKLDTTRKNIQALSQSNFHTSETTIKGVKTESLTKIKKKLKFIYPKKVLNKEQGTVTFLPIANAQYSLTFVGTDFKDAKIEIQNAEKKKLKEFALVNPSYFIVDTNGLENGNYTLVVNTLGKSLTQDFEIKRMTR